MGPTLPAVGLGEEAGARGLGATATWWPHPRITAPGVYLPFFFFFWKDEGRALWKLKM